MTFIGHGSVKADAKYERHTALKESYETKRLEIDTGQYPVCMSNSQKIVKRNFLSRKETVVFAHNDGEFFHIAAIDCDGNITENNQDKDGGVNGKMQHKSGKS